MPATSFATWAQFLDAETRTPVVGSRVFLNDRPAGVTDAAGKVWVTGESGTVRVKVLAGDVSQLNVVLTIPLGGFFPVPLVVLTPAAAQRALTFNTTPGGVLITLYAPADVDRTTPLDVVHCNGDGVGTTGRTFASGITLVAVAHKDEYQDQDASVAIVAGKDAYAIAGPTKTDNGSQEGTTPETLKGTDPTPSTAVFTSGVDQALVESASPYTYEWLFPNAEDGKYFTTTQARMYIGNLFIDELNTVQFAYQGNRIPIYGYCSEDMDAVGTGKRLVQGQLLINFISEGYLYTVLNEYQRVMSAEQVQKDARAQRAADFAAKAQILESETARTVLGEAARGRLKAELATLAANDAQVVDDAKVILTNRTSLRTARNAITLKVPFKIVMNLTGGGRTVTRTLEDCVLTSNEQIYDQSGQTLLDAYGFIARRLV